MSILRNAAAAALLLLLAQAAQAEPAAPGTLEFVPRKMSATAIAVPTTRFEARASESAQTSSHAQSLSLADVPAGAASLSVSAWVWSDSRSGALLRLAPENGNEALSAFHSGNSTWEYLTVVLPYDKPPGSVRLTLQSDTGQARFRDVKALVLHDDRFTKTLPDGCSPLRERATYTKDWRVRIVVVGASTVNGAALADKRASFPYVLQQKLEALYPGRFDVVNFGICAWHLPPQIITLDKVFNRNRACDGAAWCGQDRAFTHHNALVPEPNEDRNTPTIAQLDPDVILHAGNWNDIWRALKYASWGLEPNPVEVNRIGDLPASVVYLRSVLDWADAPTPENLLRAEARLAQAMRPLDPQASAALVFRDHASLRESPAFGKVVENAALKFAWLAEEFVRRGRRHARVWTISLPSRFGDAYEDAARRLSAGGLLAPEQVDKFLRDGYMDSVTERIQSRELERIARLHGAVPADLSRTFRDQYGALPPARQFALGYFLENVEDNVHFTYRGNQWIADRIFMAYEKQFAALDQLGWP